jgi:hypothetical protein
MYFSIHEAFKLLHKKMIAVGDHFFISLLPLPMRL